VEISSITTHILSELKIPLERWFTSALIAIFGLPGVGKTEVARYLAQRYPLCLLSIDALRLRYGLESGVITRHVMDQLAAQLLPQRVSLIFDGIHLGRKDRQAVQQLARLYHADVYLLYIVADAKTIGQRLQARIENVDATTREGKFVITPGHFARIAGYLETPTEDEAVFTVDTTNSQLHAQLSPLEEFLRRNLRGE
jgi:predicted kinase